MTINLPIKALSIRQPWAWAIINAGKGHLGFFDWRKVWGMAA